MTAAVSDTELAALIAGLQPTAPAATPTAEQPTAPEPEQTDTGPWFPANYKGDCAGCGRRFDPGELIRADGELGWLAECCGQKTTSTDGIVADRPAVPPPSTVRELRQILIDFEAQRPRSMQKALGPSELGTPCQQQIARKLAGAPRRPITEPTWAPFQGTAVHASMEEVVAFWNRQLGRERWLAEDRLTVVEGLPGVAGGPVLYPAVEGNGDAFDQDYGMVVDWKHTGVSARRKLETAKRLGKPPKEQVSQEYRVQAHLYGLGHANKGRPVKHVRLVLLARSHDFDESQEWTEAYDERIALWALERYWAVVDLMHAKGLDAVPAAPSNDACHWCPFHRPGQVTDLDGCRGHESEAAKPVTDWLATLPSSGAAPAPVR